MAENLGAKFTIDVSDLKRGLQQANRLIRESESEFKASAASMDDWKTNADGLNANLKKLNTVAEIQGAKVKALKDNYDKLIAGGMDPASSQATILRTEINNATAALNKSQTEIKETETALKNLDNESGKAASGLNDVDDAAAGLKEGFTIAKGAIANFISSGIQAATSAISGLVSEAVSASDSLYKFEQTMGFAGFDSSTIDTAKAAMKEYADQTVYDLGTIANTTAQLAANGIEDYTGLTQAAGNLNAVAGGNADTFGSLAMMLTQTAGAGKLTTENWNQLADAIPGASGKLQEALLNAGAYTGNFRDAMSKGEITAEEFNAAIMQLGNEPVAVEAATSVSTFEGAVGNMQAAVVDGLMKIINAIGMENITAFISSIADGAAKAGEKIEQFANSEAWATIKTAITDAFTWIKETGLPAIKEGFQWLIDNLPTVATVAVGLLAAITAHKIANAAATVAQTAAEQGLTVAQYAAVTAQKLLNSTMLANPISLIIMAITALVAAFIYLWNNCESFRNFWIGLWENITAWASNAWQAITGFFTSAWENIKNILGQWGAFFQGIWQGVQNVFSSVTTFFSGVFSKAWTAIKNVFKPVGSFFGNLWNIIKQKFTNIGQKIGDSMKAAIKGAVNGVLAAAEKVVNFPIRAINKLIDVINSVPGISLGQLSEFSLPRLAKGGVVTRSMLANIGEDGAEAVVPLEKNNGWIRKVAKELNQQQTKIVTNNNESETVTAAGGQSIVINQTNNYAETHSRYELYKNKQETAAAVKLALMSV